MDFYHRLLEAAGSDHVLRDEPMAVHTTFRIGGPADYFVEPADASALAKGIALCRGLLCDRQRQQSSGGRRWLQRCDLSYLPYNGSYTV